MKTIRFTLFCLFTGIFLLSCQNDELEKGNTSEIVLPREGLLLDGGRISDISLYCLELDKPHIGEQWWEYYPRTKTVKGYDAFKLLLFPHTNGNRYNSGDRNEMDAIKKIEEEYYKAQTRRFLCVFSLMIRHKSRKIVVLPKPGGEHISILFGASVKHC